MTAVVRLAQKMGMLLVAPSLNSAVTAPQPHVIDPDSRLPFSFLLLLDVMVVNGDSFDILSDSCTFPDLPSSPEFHFNEYLNFNHDFPQGECSDQALSHSILTLESSTAQELSCQAPWSCQISR